MMSNWFYDYCGHKSLEYNQAQFLDNICSLFIELSNPVTVVCRVARSI